jgi:hypothetical protein
MKKMFFLFTMLSFILSACVPAILQQPQATSPAPISEADIQATVAIQVEQTIQSLPSPTLAPSNTPVVMTATNTAIQATSTSTPVLLTLTATLATGTALTLPSSTAGITVNLPPTGTPYYQYAGTMPPDLPYGNISLINMSKTDASISLRCTTKDGYVTNIDYPLGGSTVDDAIPAGSYTYVAWVGGKQFTNSFKLSKFQDLKFIIYKDRIEIK